MAAINNLLRQITDPTLRERLTAEIDRMAKNKKFGLVFEEHIPECTPLYGVPIRRGSTVARKTGKMSDIFTVKTINGDEMLCENKVTMEIATFKRADLVAVAQFGEPIFPSLEPIAKVQNAPNDSLWHTLIEADNYHALQLLEYLYEGQVDCIYIDPPYNTGARDWKYNNDYVDSSDAWRHSKWLSMMQKRLKVAKRLLNPETGVLITTIDDNEYAHLWVLLKEIFPEYKNYAVTIQHNPRGTQGDRFAVTHEFAIYTVAPKWKINRKTHTGNDISNFRKWGNQSERSNTARATTFFPVIVDENMSVVGFGEILPLSEHPHNANIRKGKYTYVYPIDGNGIERKWRYSKQNESEVLPFLSVVERDGVLDILINRGSENVRTVWTDTLYNAEQYGTKLVNAIVQNPFSYPKSLYAVHDSLWYAIHRKKDALIVDFFAGSGTTLHAVNLLNAEDGGNRRCIIVTNNEVSDAESRTLQKQGFQPGDAEWERRGICRSVTWPRTEYSILGKRADGTVLTGEYAMSDDSKRPMSEGFPANVEYFKLGFLDKNSVSLGKQFAEILPLLWLKAGAVGERPELDGEDLPEMLILPQNAFAVLLDEDRYGAFAEQLAETDGIDTVYFVTNSEEAFREMSDEIGQERTYQLYRDYIDNFVIGSRRNNL
jgi:adenine-specific DNA-methyltransferase